MDYKELGRNLEEKLTISDKCESPGQEGGGCRGGGNGSWKNSSLRWRQGVGGDKRPWLSGVFFWVNYAVDNVVASPFLLA